MGKNDLIIARVSEIYNWIEQQQLANSGLVGRCAACGKCCDFEQYDHRLYVTTPEMLFFVDKLGEKNIKKMTGGRCSYQINNKCSVYDYRFAACRIFSCKGNADFQSELTETVLKKFKTLCDELQIPYRYVELPAALKSVVTAENEK